MKRLFPDVPVVAGGIEVSLRRLAHYDYWQDRLRPSILVDCPADLLVYGMGELPNIAIADALAAGRHIEELTDIPQTVVRRPLSEMPAGDSDTDVVLHPDLQRSQFSEVEVLVSRDAAYRDDEFWTQHRIDSLTERILNTYHLMDSITEGNDIFDRMLNTTTKLMNESALGLGPIDLNLGSMLRLSENTINWRNYCLEKILRVCRYYC